MSSINSQKIYLLNEEYEKAKLKPLDSMKEGEIAIQHIAGFQTVAKLENDLIPGAVYTNPGVASFGLKEKEAQEAGIKYKTFVFPIWNI